MNVGATELIIIVVILVGYGIPIWAIVDAAMVDAAAWHATGRSKALWLTLLIVFTLLCNLVGLILSIVYLAAIRRSLRTAGA